jgi:hypothetical protein
VWKIKGVPSFMYILEFLSNYRGYLEPEKGIGW